MSQQSSSRQPRLVALACADASSAARVSTTPRGWPVVPEVKRIAAESIGRALPARRNCLICSACSVGVNFGCSSSMLAANFLGAQLLRGWETLLTRIPIVRSIYSGVKQVSDTLFSQKGQSFRKVVLIEFPQRGQWTLGFIVGSPGEQIEAKAGTSLVTVYVPTAPNPTSGYVLMMPMGELHEIDISVDDALKFHISLGVVVPNARAARAVLTSESPGAG